MHIEIIRVRSPKDFQLLSQLDQKMFSKADAFGVDDWKGFRCFLLFLNKRSVGSVAVKHHFVVGEDKEFTSSHGTLYIGSTGILPRYQGRGLGLLLKAWEIVYARQNGFKRLETTVRVTNEKIINLNQKFGFHTTRVSRAYWENPVEDALTMELVLT